MGIQHRRRAHPIRRWLEGVVIAIVVALAALCVAAVASGRYQVRPVLSGSMRPGLPVGGIVVTQQVPASSLNVRDVIVFHRPDKPDELVVHRIVTMKQGPSGPVVQTQGDANNAADPWTVTLQGDTAYRAVFSLPYAGYVAVWMHSPAGRTAILLVGLALVIGAGVSGVFSRRAKKPEPNPHAELEPMVEVTIEHEDSTLASANQG